MANLDDSTTVEPSTNTTSTPEGTFSSEQLARIRSFFPAFEAKILELDPEFKGHCSGLTTWKRTIADQLLSEVLFANLVDTQQGKTQKGSRKVRSVWPLSSIHPSSSISYICRKSRPILIRPI